MIPLCLHLPVIALNLGSFFEHLQYQRILQFLMGLNDNYSQARGQILLMQQIPSINQVYAMINQDESQKMVAESSRVMSESMTPTTMFTSKPVNGNQKQKKNYNPGAFCDFCRMKGHVREG